MIRILHIVTSMNRGGLETLLMNCFRCMDRDRIQFDFLVHRSSPGDYDREIETLGGRIHRLPRLNPLHPGYYLALNHFFRSHPEYRIVHCHLDCMSALPLSAARKHSVPVRIAHSHNTSQDRDWKYPLKRILMKQTPRFATHFFACSRASGNWMFPGHPVSLIKNGIDTQCFRFSPPLRSQVRRELSLEGSLVVGHTGRLVPQKNHAFLLEIFAELHRRNADAVLLLAGEGPLESSLRRRAESLGISHQVRFLGMRDDVHRLLQAMDVFVMPSYYEGLSLSAVEAQACGLPCLFSDALSAECALTARVQFLSLTLSPKQWAEEILSAAALPRTSGHEAVRDAGFDIQTTADTLHSFYQENW